MYRIIKSDGTELGVTDHVNYIKIGKSGDFTMADEETAIGIAHRSVAYNLIGQDVIEGADSVIVQRDDSGNVFVSVDKMATAIQEGVDDVE